MPKYTCAFYFKVDEYDKYHVQLRYAIKVIGKGPAKWITVSPDLLND
ncbi:hypothetical protein HMPREF1152_0960 [Mogibacterium sp. CM50]|uniref:Uncharacterized protein n=1 Tax=Mogibacterium timidum ATCC 33093 TaxID=1401079 RepID=X8ISQ6_9FIRM|nr:hypothetical protein HMPREF1152_0960 [Mogibacterium sp. CM50]EUC52041.1 hypothetical protein HMPREF0581_0470 [Mogibacterium timidum ATCC 33093]